MSITELSVKRPAALFMVLLLVIGLGILGYSNLGADLFPSVDVPIVSIVTTYPGASVEEIEKDINKPIEDAVSSISGIDIVRSGAAEGYGYTILQFTMKTDANVAFVDVQQALGDISSKLPKDASRPSLHKANKNAEPILSLSISGNVPFDELYSKADDLKQTIEKIEGVGTVTLAGAEDKELHINVDKTAIETYKININMIINRLLTENINIPAGEIEQDARIQKLTVKGEFSDINEIKDLKIPTLAGGAVRLGDIAEVVLESPETTQQLRLNDTNSIGLFVQKQSDANIVETSNTVKEKLAQIQKSLPDGIKITIAVDQSKFISNTLSEVQRNLIEGIITTSIVMFLFIRKWRSSLIVLVSIPTSLIATFFMMYVFGFTLNLMSLMGLSVCIGILVDDSIVVLENIQRHLRMGENPIKAAIEGRKEIGMAAIAITLCDVVVFGPMAFMSDMIGKFFREFGLTVVFATLFSLLVSFTLTPMLSSRLLRSEDEIDEGVEKKDSRFAKFFDNVKNKYRKFLEWSLDNKWKIVFIVSGLFAASLAMVPLKIISTEFIPSTDQGKLTIDIALNPGSTLAQTDAKTKIIEKYLKSLPEVKEYFSAIGSDTDRSVASININLADKNERKKSQNQMATQIRNWGKKLDGIDFTVTESSIVGQTSMDGSKPVVLNISGPDIKVLKEISTEVEKIVKSVPGVTDVSNSARESKSELNINLDRLAVSEYGLMSSDIATAIRTAINGTNAGVFRRSGNEYDIIVKYAVGQVVTPSDIASIKVTSQAGLQISLGQVADIAMVDSPQGLVRQDRQSMVTVAANIQDRKLGAINTDIRLKIDKLHLPNGYEIKFGGDQQNMNTSFTSLLLALAASIALVYMILVVLYESYLTPFIRMLSLPVGAIGAFVALVVTGRSLNILTLIGLIMLDGLASKNGTLLIDYTNTLLKRGVGLREALIESGVTRLRPIIMTSATMIVGMLPAALALGEGSEIKSGMAVALIGGMITSTILSPVLLPAAYMLIDDFRHRISKKNKPNLSGGAVI